MDVWMVAAAAGVGAGYAVQNLKNLTRAKKTCLDLSSENLNFVRPEFTGVRQKVEDKRCPLRRVLSWRSSGEEMSEEREKVCEVASDSEGASTSGYGNENLVMLDNFAILNEEEVKECCECTLSSESESNEVSVVDSLPRPSTSEVGFCYSYERKRSCSLRSRRINSQSIKPRTSLESCLMAQLCEEHAECTYSLSPLQKPTVRPFLVTDGIRVISTTPYKSFSEATGVGREFKKWKDVYSDEDKTVHGVPGLPNLVKVELQKRSKTGNGKGQALRRIHYSKNQDNAQGTSDRALLFCLGLTMGIISSILANEQEVEKLKISLKQTENLVQDLQEELEMKDSLTVKELATEDFDSLDVHDDRCFDDTVHVLSLEHNLIEENCDENAEVKSISTIEAELEAELQRLESNMISSSLNGKLSNLVELDPNLASAAPELRGDEDESRGSTPRSAHYSISPRELSLRLHQVIQARLEERVKELETALEDSQRKLKYMESDHIHPWRDPSNYKTGHFSTKDSPIARDGQEPVDQPVAISLSGEPLASYNEEFTTKVSESDDEDLKIGFKNGYDVGNGHMDQHSASNGNQETVFDRRRDEDVYSLSNDNACSSNSSSRRDEGGDGEDDEMERLLIMQIVEKAKQGSPAVLKAKRDFLLSNLEIEH
ncbi:hypothetical protein ACS0TY_006699 [Phlomoides rotata]